MAGFPRKTFEVSSTGHVYSYIRVPATSSSKTNLLFLHGFPAVALTWHHQIRYFRDLGYGIIAPDLLGFGLTSKPTAIQDYRTKIIVEDINAIIEHEGIEKYHGIGHDAGTFVLSRLINYYPDKLLSVTFISLPYTPPAMHFDLPVMNGLMQKLIGIEKFGYIQFLAEDRSSAIIEKHLESFMSIAYTSNQNSKADNFYPPGRLEAWLDADQRDPDILLDEDEQKVWLEAFGQSGFFSLLNWYRTMVENSSEAEEKADLDAGKLNTTISVPVLCLTATPDKTVIPGSMEAGTKNFSSSEVTVKVVSSQGHYPHLTSRNESNQVLEEFLAAVTG